MTTNFDANFIHGVGRVAGVLRHVGESSYVESLSGLTKIAGKWTLAGFPLTMMMSVESRQGKDVAAIKKKTGRPCCAPVHGACC